MITEMGPNIDISIYPAHEAMADSSGNDKNYVNRVVCLNSDAEICYPTAITDKPFGILIEGGKIGEYVTVRTFGIVPIKLNAIVALPNYLSITADAGVVDGRAGVAVATAYTFGQLMQASDAEDDIVTAIIDCINCTIKA